MKLSDKACFARGFVSPSFVDMSTGRKIPFGMRHNTLSYMSAEAVAAAFGGDQSYIPSRVGFIYGGESGSAPDSPITRTQSWQSLKSELGSKSLDVQVVGFSYLPTLGPDPTRGDSSDSSPESGGGEGDYCNILSSGSNAITFHAVSNSSEKGVFRPLESPFSANNTVFQAVLLAGVDVPYYVLSRVSLQNVNGKYPSKPSGFEIALDWTVVFR